MTENRICSPSFMFGICILYDFMFINLYVASQICYDLKTENFVFSVAFRLYDLRGTGYIAHEEVNTQKG